MRSRNAEGDEGTDFARAKRQQLVIQAIKKKLLRKEILFSPKKLMQLKEVAGKYIETDIDIEAVAILARRLLQAKDNIHSSVLPEDFLENPPKSAKYDYLYVFVPKVGDWSEVHEWTECILLEKECY